MPIGEGIAATLSDLAASGRPERVAISALLPADSPRLDGERIDHIQALADTVVDLPPILVHRPSMRVVDGMHRLRAAQLRGAKTIEVYFLDTSEDLVFAAAVLANIAHGLPLSLADRRAAAGRILASHPHWSDRTIARVAGLSPSTVAAIRHQGPERLAGQTRVGRDGRVRSLSTAEGRRLAGEMISERPDASLREVARAAGISTRTVRDVRRRLERGEDPALPQRRQDGEQTPTDVGPRQRSARGHLTAFRQPSRDRAAILQNLRSDPSLRFSQTGRELIRWLDTRSEGLEAWETMMQRLPEHCGYLVAELAHWCSQRWLKVAELARARTDTVDGDGGAPD